MKMRHKNKIIFITMILIVLLMVILVGFVNLVSTETIETDDKIEGFDFSDETESESMNLEFPSGNVIKEDFSKYSLLWDHMPITYYIENKQECGKIEVEEIRIAFEEITGATKGAVKFQGINEPADIDIHCSFIKDCYKLEIEEHGDYDVYTEHICEHTAGQAQITESKENKILKAKIELIGLYGFQETKDYGHGGQSGFTIGQCQRARVEIHEILHIFGYGHTEDLNSIMNPANEDFGGRYTKNCSDSPKVFVDDEIADDLIKKYR